LCFIFREKTTRTFRDSLIQSTNEKNKNKYPEYINSNVKNSEKHINENERYQINDHSNNQVDYMKNLKKSC